ncbi:MAG: hypothetical protein WDZ27_06505 [Waddliaceae bacterium]
MGSILLTSMPIGNENNHFFCIESPKGHTVCYKGFNYSKIENLVDKIPALSNASVVIAIIANYLWAGTRYQVITDKNCVINEPDEDDFPCKIETPTFKDGLLTYYVKDQQNGWLKKVTYKLHGNNKPEYRIPR